jgi:hypothetical protein
MGNPVAAYQDDAADFLRDYRKKIVDPALEDYQKIVNDFSERYDRAYQMINPFYAEAYRDQSYYLSNQWSPQEIQFLNNQGRSSYTYNMCMRMINLIEGIQRQNRLATKAFPIENSSDRTAEILSDAIQYTMTKGGGYDMLSTGFKDAMVTGISWISPWIDYRDDPINGEIKYNLSHWNDTIWDPFFYNQDLSDCSFFARRKYLSRSAVISLLPDKEEEILRLSYGTRDNKFTYIPYVRQGALNKLMSYTEYWCKKWAVRDVIVDMTSGETMEWNGPKDRINAILSMHPNLRKMRKPCQQVELGIIVENQLLYYGRDPYGLDDYGFCPIFAVYEPSYDLFQWKMQSLIRLIRDPQTELNKRRSKMVDILDSSLNSGWILKTNALTNNQSAYKSGQGQVMFAKPETNIDTDIKRIDPPIIPEGHFALMEQFMDDIPNILGINPEMLGMPENDKVETAAMLAKMRVNAGLISLRRLFDNLSITQKMLGEKTMKLIQKNYSAEKVKLITKKEPTPEFFSSLFSRYDIVIEEGALTDTQRQNNFLSLMSLRQIGINIPDSMLIENANVHDKDKLNEILDAQAKQQEDMLNKQQQLEMEKLRVMTDGIESKALSDQALAQERTNKIKLDAALSEERIQRAEEDRTAGVLNLVKAVKELEGMDLQALMSKVQVLRELEGQQEALAKMGSQESKPKAA